MKELIKKHEEFDKRMNANDDKINQMMQFADRLNDENHYAGDKITEKARSIDERQAKILLSLLVCLFVCRGDSTYSDLSLITILHRTAQGSRAGN